MKENNDSLELELQQVKLREHSLQQCKERLKKMYEMTTSSKQLGTSCGIGQMAQGLTESSKKLFLRLHSHCDDIYQLKLLRLELNQQLMVATATKEEDTILRALRADAVRFVDLSEGSHHQCEDEIQEDDSILSKWFQEMSSTTGGTNLESTNGDDRPITNCQINEDRLHYWAKIETWPGSLGDHQVLSFSTRHCSVCVHLCIKTQVRRIPEETSLSSMPGTHAYTITSDIPLPGLQRGLQRSLDANHGVDEFVTTSVWKIMEDSVIPLIFTN